MAGWLKDGIINTDRNLKLQYLAGLGLNLYRSDAIYKAMIRESKYPDSLFVGSQETLERAPSEDRRSARSTRRTRARGPVGWRLEPEGEAGVMRTTSRGGRSSRRCSWRRSRVQGPTSVAKAPERFTMRVVASGFASPWEIAWGPDGQLWVTEREASASCR